MRHVYLLLNDQFTFVNRAKTRIKGIKNVYHLQSWHSMNGTFLLLCKPFANCLLSNHISRQSEFSIYIFFFSSWNKKHTCPNQPSIWHGMLIQCQNYIFANGRYHTQQRIYFQLVYSIDIQKSPYMKWEQKKFSQWPKKHFVPTFSSQCTHTHTRLVSICPKLTKYCEFNNSLYNNVN